MDVIITPKKLSGKIKAISSKSVAHRMFICASVADGESEIEVDSLSRDIEVTISALEAMGAEIKRKGSVFYVTPIKDKNDCVVDCCDSGSTLRFLVPLGAALGKKCVFTGKGRLPQRPMGTLLSVLNENGVKTNSSFPIEIEGQLEKGNFEIDGGVSSQFITGLLMALNRIGGGEIKVKGKTESKSYIDITLSVMKKFGVNVTEKESSYIVPDEKFSAGKFVVEGDWSNAAFFLASGVEVENLDLDSKQGDKKFKDILPLLESDEEEIFIDVSDIPDLVPIIAVKASVRKGKTNIINAERLKLKESDRIVSTVSMINDLGGQAEGDDKSITVFGKEKLKGGEVSSFNDHRIAMATAIASQYCEEKVIIRDAEAVEKSYPDFYEHFRQLGGICDVL